MPARELLDDHEADVVPVAARTRDPGCRARRRAGRATRRGRRAARAGAWSSPPRRSDRRRSRAARGLAVGAPRPRRLLALGALLALDARARSSARSDAVTLASTVSSGSSSSVTPCGHRDLAEGGASRRCRARRRRPRGAAGTSSGSASTLISFVTCERTPPSLTPDRLADERDRDGRLDRLVEADLLQVDVRDRAAHLVALVVLEDRRVLRAPVDATSSTACEPADVVSAARRSRSPTAIATGSRARRGRPGSAPACAGAGTRPNRAWSAPRRSA